MAYLKTNRTYYSMQEALKDSITVGELIEELSHIPSNEKIVFSNDGGYTYGYINSSVVKY